MTHRREFLRSAVAAVALGHMAQVWAQTRGDAPDWQAFLAAAGTDEAQAKRALVEIGARWRDAYTPMVVDVMRFLPSTRGGQPVSAEGPDISNEVDGPDRSGALAGRGGFPPTVGWSPQAEIRRRLAGFLEQQTGQRFGDDLRAWRKWMWALAPDPHPDYPSFKAELYGRIDAGFRAFFPPRVTARIRLDEIDWGGVSVNGIPPLRFPKTSRAAEATWLRDGHLVFGITIYGEARAYPKRILAWHEMAVDRVGGVDLTIVYCTLCGTVIPYESAAGGRRFTFGTSGLLYRSNKLMFDEETRSLWSSLEGVPVVGPLVSSGLTLPFRPVVTTTWGEWRRQHPATTVLSLDTGYERDYGEGVAYRQYFGHDRLMFDVPQTDARLKNKAEVLVLRPAVLGGDVGPLAIAVDRLRREPVYAFEAGRRRLVVVTSAAGANRVFDRGPHTFLERLPDGSVQDATGGRWRVADEALVSDTGEELLRIPAHRAFWFAWSAQFPDTALHK